MSRRAICFVLLSRRVSKNQANAIKLFITTLFFFSFHQVDVKYEVRVLFKKSNYALFITTQ